MWIASWYSTYSCPGASAASTASSRASHTAIAIVVPSSMLSAPTITSSSSLHFTDDIARSNSSGIQTDLRGQICISGLIYLAGRVRKSSWRRRGRELCSCILILAFDLSSFPNISSYRFLEEGQGSRTSGLVHWVINICTTPVCISGMTRR